MSRSRELGDPVLLGLASGMRTFVAPATLAVRGRLGGPAGKRILPVLALGEMAADKYPAAPSRTEGRGLGGRIVGAALSGNTVGGAQGAVTALCTAAVATFAFHWARTAASQTFPDPAVAVVEDLLAVALATAATR